MEEPVTALVELDRVDVDLSLVLVRKDEVRCGASGLDVEADSEQCLLQLEHIRCVQNDVEISMLTRLLARLEAVAQRRPIIIAAVGLDFDVDWLRARKTSSVALTLYESHR